MIDLDALRDDERRLRSEPAALRSMLQSVTYELKQTRKLLKSELTNRGLTEEEADAYLEDRL